jgi:hypothetical protein
MIGWNHTTRKMANEAVIALNNTMVVSGLDSEACERGVQPTLKMANKAVKDHNNARVVSGLDSEVYEGDVQLEITPFESFSQIGKYKKYLATIKDIKVVSENWSEEEGFNIVVSVRVPLVLGRILLDMPEVARVKLNSNKSCHNGQKHGNKKMVVVMKTLETTPELSLE